MPSSQQVHKRYIHLFAQEVALCKAVRLAGQASQARRASTPRHSDTPTLLDTARHSDTPTLRHSRHSRHCPRRSTVKNPRHWPTLLRHCPATALNLRTLSVGQAPSQSWYSGLHSLAPCVGHLWKMNYYRASSTELSFAQGAATATAPAILLPLDPMPTHPREHPFSQESGTRLDLQARSSTMRRSTVAEEAGVP